MKSVSPAAPVLPALAAAYLQSVITITHSIKSKFFFFIDMIDNMIFFLKEPIKQHREGSIPKEAPWKTSALNERTYRFGEFSTATSGTERKRGFVGILPSLCDPIRQHIPLFKKQLTLFQTTLHLKTDFLFPSSSQEKTALSLSHYNISC